MNAPAPTLLLLLHVPLLQKVLGHCPCHLCDTLGWRVVELHNLVVHVFINVYNGCLVAAPARFAQQCVSTVIDPAAVAMRSTAQEAPTGAPHSESWQTAARPAANATADHAELCMKPQAANLTCSNSLAH
jgi:hypothetical protein